MSYEHMITMDVVSEAFLHEALTWSITYEVKMQIAIIPVYSCYWYDNYMYSPTTVVCRKNYYYFIIKYKYKL